MSFLFKNLRTLNILRHAYNSKRENGLFIMNNVRTKLLIASGGPVLSRSMAHEAIKNIGVEELKNYQNNDKLIIDVREHEEIAETGVIPGGINIPLGEVPEALSKTPEDFESAYGKRKPEKNDTLIFSCRSGKRSSMAAQKAVELGYNKNFILYFTRNYTGQLLRFERLKSVINFKGGWLEWERVAKS